jgi:hypothetical protein
VSDHQCDGRKRIEAGLARLYPVIPKTRDEHASRGLWIELQDEVLLVFIGSEFAVLVQVLRDVLVEAANDHDGMAAPVTARQ